MSSSIPAATHYGKRDDGVVTMERKTNGGQRMTAPALQIMMCRFIDGKLETCPQWIAEAEYVAISHVWGDAKWQTVPGIEEKILVSNAKARFLSERLPEIVGNQYFWMDILCVDQRNDENRVAITQYIPTIFRFAQRTVAIRDGDVFAPCCADSTDFDEMIRHSLAPSRIEGYLDLRGNQSFFQALFSHLETAHHHVSVLDGLLFRLWPLQEILLSDTLQFVACGSDQTSVNLYAEPGAAAKVNAAFVLTTLHFMASMWEEHGGEQPLLSDHNISSKSHFIHAFFRYGTVHRARTS